MINLLPLQNPSIDLQDDVTKIFKFMQTGKYWLTFGLHIVPNSFIITLDFDRQLTIYYVSIKSLKSKRELFCSLKVDPCYEFRLAGLWSILTPPDIS